MARNVSKNPASTAESPTLQPEHQQETTPSASEALGAYEDAATSLANDAKQAAKAAYEAVRQQGTEFATDVGAELGKTANAQKDRGVEAMTGFVRAFQNVAGDLEDQSPAVAQYVRDAASKVERLTQNVGNRDVTELMKAATDLARSQPALFFGGAVAAGFVLSRVLKSSASDMKSSRGGAQATGEGSKYAPSAQAGSEGEYTPGQNPYDIGTSGRSEKVAG